jgi:uncharacterized repeat protein (TIGR01451 family)
MPTLRVFLRFLLQVAWFPLVTMSAVSAQQPSSDLSITKQVSPVVAAPGDLVTYTLIVHNAGPDTETALVYDILPTGLTLASAPQCVETPPTVLTCSLLSPLDPGTDGTLTIVAQVGSVPTGPIQNAASVSGNNSDPNTANNTASATLIIASPIPALTTIGLVSLAIFIAALAVARLARHA